MANWAEQAIYALINVYATNIHIIEEITEEDNKGYELFENWILSFGKNDKIEDAFEETKSLRAKLMEDNIIKSHS